MPGLTIGGKTEPRQEIDHLISLQIGGADDFLNLWPEPAQNPIAGANDKDKIEDKSKEELCQILKADGDKAADEYIALIQRAIAGGYDLKKDVGVASGTNWYDVYHQNALPHLDQCSRINPKEKDLIKYNDYLAAHKKELMKIVLNAIQPEGENCKAPGYPDYRVSEVPPSDTKKLREQYKDALAADKLK